MLSYQFQLFQIKVRYGYDEPCDGTLVTCCLNYNLAFIKVKERCQVRPMPMGGRDCLSDDFEVFAVGRHYLSGDIMIASGTTTSKTNPFDCAELMFSTCKITKVFSFLSLKLLFLFESPVDALNFFIVWRSSFSFGICVFFLVIYFKNLFFRSHHKENDINRMKPFLFHKFRSHGKCLEHPSLDVNHTISPSK